MLVLDAPTGTATAGSMYPLSVKNYLSLSDSGPEVVGTYSSYDLADHNGNKTCLHMCLVKRLQQNNNEPAHGSSFHIRSK